MANNEDSVGRACFSPTEFCAQVQYRQRLTMLLLCRITVTILGLLTTVLLLVDSRKIDNTIAQHRRDLPGNIDTVQV